VLTREFFDDMGLVSNTTQNIVINGLEEAIIRAHTLMIELFDSHTGVLPRYMYGKFSFP